MQLKFTKMQGTGNDFVVIDAIHQSVQLTTQQIRQLGDRHFGVGCDQILLVEPSATANTDFRYRIFNRDGNEVEQCGNGARCFARFVHEKGLTTKSTIRVETIAGIIEIFHDDSGEVTVDMGQPVFTPGALPLLVDLQSDRYLIEIDHCSLAFGAVSMGNPHAVFQVEDVQVAHVQHWGELLQSHALFPQRVNVGFMQVVNKDRIRLRVYERGSGETLACGTGACAAVVVGILWKILNNRVTVELPGGNLLIRWEGENTSVFLTGPAQTVFEGQITL